MNRFEYSSPSLQQNETYIARELGVKIYDGELKVFILSLFLNNF